MSNKDLFFEQMMKEEYPTAGSIRRLWERFVYQFVYFFHKEQIEEIIETYKSPHTRR